VSAFLVDFALADSPTLAHPTSIAAASNNTTPVNRVMVMFNDPFSNGLNPCCMDWVA